MASIVKEQLNSWRYLTSVAVTSGVAAGDMVDFRNFTQGAIYATSTHGTPVLTWYTAASSTGPFRLLKTSTGGAVTTTIIANAAIKFPASVAGASWFRLSSSTTAAVKTIPAMVLKK